MRTRTAVPLVQRVAGITPIQETHLAREITTFPGPAIAILQAETPSQTKAPVKITLGTRTTIQGNRTGRLETKTPRIRIKVGAAATRTKTLIPATAI